jgi:hypothetical protein
LTDPSSKPAICFTAYLLIRGLFVSGGSLDDLHHQQSAMYGGAGATPRSTSSTSSSPPIAGAPGGRHRKNYSINNKSKKIICIFDCLFKNTFKMRKIIKIISTKL